MDDYCRDNLVRNAIELGIDCVLMLTLGVFMFILFFLMFWGIVPVYEPTTWIRLTEFVMSIGIVGYAIYRVIRLFKYYRKLISLLY